MVRFKIDILAKNKSEFYRLKYIYLKNMQKNNYNVKEIEMDKNEFEKLENSLPHKYCEDDSIFIKNDIQCLLCLEQSGFTNNIRIVLPEICNTKIIKTEDKTYIRPLDKGVYIDQIIVNMVKNIICKGSMDSGMFEFKTEQESSWA